MRGCGPECVSRRRALAVLEVDQPAHIGERPGYGERCAQESLAVQLLQRRAVEPGQTLLIDREAIRNVILLGFAEADLHRYGADQAELLKCGEHRRGELNPLVD